MRKTCFMANRIKLSMIPAFSLFLGFLIDAFDVKASVYFCLEKMQNTIATNFYLSRGRKLNNKKSNLNQEWGLFKKYVSNSILIITNVVGALSQTSSLSLQRLIQVSCPDFLAPFLCQVTVLKMAIFYSNCTVIVCFLVILS